MGQDGDVSAGLGADEVEGMSSEWDACAVFVGGVWSGDVIPAMNVLKVDASDAQLSMFVTDAKS